MKGKMMKIGLWVGLLLWLPASILAQEKPAAAEAMKVIDYFYQGKGQGAILMAHKLCAQIYEEGPLKYECQEEITGGQIQKDREVYLWMNYLNSAGTHWKYFVSLLSQGVLSSHAQRGRRLFRHAFNW